LQVFKSKKWKERDEKPKGELLNRVSLSTERITRNEQENYPTGSRELPNRVITKKTLQDSTKTEQSVNQKKSINNIKGDAPMFDATDRSLKLTGKPWKALGLTSLPEGWAEFVKLADTVEPIPGKSVADWGQRVLKECARRSIKYPRAFLKLLGDAERSGSTTPLEPLSERAYRMGVLLTNIGFGNHGNLSKTDWKVVADLLRALKENGGLTASQCAEVERIYSECRKKEEANLGRLTEEREAVKRQAASSTS
jgi:hypothetical protein